MRSSSATSIMAAAAVLFFSSNASVVTAFHASSSSSLMANAAAAAPSSRLTNTQLEAANGGVRPSFSELDKLRSKRLSLRRPVQLEPPSSSSDAQFSSDPQGLEYLYDETEERHADDFFHVILMPSTFAKKQMSIEQATESILSTLSSLPSLASSSSVTSTSYEKVRNLSLFAKHQGFALIGTWTRTECLMLGEQLQNLDLDCRVIPYSDGLLKMTTSTMLLPSPSSSLLLDESSRNNVVAVEGSFVSSSSDYLLSLSR